MLTYIIQTSFNIKCSVQDKFMRCLFLYEGTMPRGHIRKKRPTLHLLDFNNKYQKLIYIEFVFALNMTQLPS